VNNTLDLTHLAVGKAQVFALEAALQALPQVEIVPEMFYGHKSVARVVRIPAGTTLTGHIHKYPQINIAVGDISVTTDTGVQRLTGFNIVESPAGTKRAGHAHADTIWVTIHGSTATDVETLEAEMIAHSEAEFLEFCDAQQLGSS
jgi:hypothetical protein